LDLVERSEQITFEIGLEDRIEKSELLDIFKVDPEYGQNEKLWTEIKAQILGEDDSDDEDDEDDEDEEPAIVPGSAAASLQTTEIKDLTDQDLVNLRRTVYLTIM
jgi:pre-mRNA-splicing factor CWC22